jgi:hypothetical protein
MIRMHDIIAKKQSGRELTEEEEAQLRTFAS